MIGRLRDYNEAIRLDPKHAWAINGRGDVHMARKNHDQAFSDYSEALRLDPTQLEFWLDRGALWHGKKEDDKAIADFNEAIRVDPKCAEAYGRRGAAWSAKKDYRNAIGDFSESIRLDPNDFHAYDSRAWLWATCPDAKYRDGKKAVESATKACELSNWKEAYPIGALAAAYAEAGDFDAAVTWQAKANATLLRCRRQEEWGCKAQALSGQEAVPRGLTSFRPQLRHRLCLHEPLAGHTDSSRRDGGPAWVPAAGRGGGSARSV